MTTVPKHVLNDIRPSPWCEVESTYLRELQVKAHKFELLETFLGKEFSIDDLLALAEFEVRKGVQSEH